MVLAVALVGCKHKCEEDGGEVNAAIDSEGLALEGYEVCGWMTETSEAEHFSKLYYPKYISELVVEYVPHMEKQGWERVGCPGGNHYGPDDGLKDECFTKEGRLAKLHFYDFGHHVLGVIPRDGTVVDLALDVKLP